MSSLDMFEALTRPENPVFGFMECDIEVPQNTPDPFDPSGDLWADVFDEMYPLFFNADVRIDDMGPPMKTYAEERGEFKRPRRLLVGGRKAGKVLLITPLFRLYVACAHLFSRLHE